VRLYLRGKVWMNPFCSRSPAEAGSHDRDGVCEDHQLKQVAKDGAG